MNYVQSDFIPLYIIHYNYDSPGNRADESTLLIMDKSLASGNRSHTRYSTK